jgi:hypothetical protein
LKQSQKTRITVNAMHTNGIPLIENAVLVSDASMKDSPVDGFRVVELRFIVPTRNAEDLFDSLRKGDVELLIQDIPPKI